MATVIAIHVSNFLATATEVFFVATWCFGPQHVEFSCLSFSYTSIPSLQYISSLVHTSVLFQTAHFYSVDGPNFIQRFFPALLINSKLHNILSVFLSLMLTDGDCFMKYSPKIWKKGWMVYKAVCYKYLGCFAKRLSYIHDSSVYMAPNRISFECQPS